MVDNVMRSHTSHVQTTQRFDWEECFKPEFDTDRMAEEWTKSFLKIAKDNYPQ